MEGSGANEQTGPFCPQCGRRLPTDSKFCQFCGGSLASESAPAHHAHKVPVYPVYYPPRPVPPEVQLRQLVSRAAAWVALLIMIEAAVNIAIMIAGCAIVFPQTATHSYPIYIIFPWLITVFRIGSWELVGFYIFLAVSITASFFVMVNKSHMLKKELDGVRPTEGHSPLFVTATLMFAVLSFSVLFYMVLGLFGVHPTTIDLDNEPVWAQLLSFAGASVWEEVVSRMLLIGVPLLFIDLARRKFADPKHYVLGGGFNMGIWEISFLVFSAAMFALAHISLWDWYKVLPTFLSGLALGYLFLRYGIYASIMMHFFIDYLTIPYYASNKAALVSLPIFFLELAMIVIGIACFIYYAGKVIGFLEEKSGRKKPAPSPYAPAPPQPHAPPQPGQPQYAPRPTAPAFVCKNCGGTEARYEDGALYCLRCGKKD